MVGRWIVTPSIFVRVEAGEPNMGDWYNGIMIGLHPIDVGPIPTLPTKIWSRSSDEEQGPYKALVAGS